MISLRRGVKTEAMTVRLTPDLLKRARKAAKKSGSSLVAVVEYCLEKALPELENVAT
jgi:predicted HicB family RNase H-like nuclease